MPAADNTQPQFDTTQFSPTTGTPMPDDPTGLLFQAPDYSNVPVRRRQQKTDDEQADQGRENNQGRGNNRQRRKQQNQQRSEERRVGKECRSGRAKEHWRRTDRGNER